jgi:hypothetical protein
VQPNEPTTQLIDESKFTPAQQLALEQSRAENEASKVELAKLQQRRHEAEAEHASLLKGQAMRDAVIASGVKFHDDALASTLAESYDLRFSDTGEGSGVVAGKRVSLDKVYQAIALKHPTITDGRSTRGLKADDVPTTKARSQMSQAEQIKFINDFSYEEFVKLPAHAVRLKAIECVEDYVGLPVATKTKLLAQNGLAWLEKLPRTKKKF